MFEDAIVKIRSHGPGALMTKADIKSAFHLLPISPVLTNDLTLNTILPAKPQVVYRGAPSLRGTIATNIIDPPPINKRGFFDNLTGFYQCRYEVSRD